jgi:ribosomal RNA-processing protein 8
LSNSASLRPRRVRGRFSGTMGKILVDGFSYSQERILLYQRTSLLRFMIMPVLNELDTRPFTMFAVPGWKVSADSLVTQGSSHIQPENNKVAHCAPASSSKKRKRDEPEQRISAQELDRLWKKHFGTSSDNSGSAAKAKLWNGEESKHFPRTEPNLENSKPSSKMPVAKEDGGHSRKKGKKKHKQPGQGFGLAQEPKAELSPNPSVLPSGDLGKKAVDKATNRHVSQSSQSKAKVPDSSPPKNAMPPSQLPPQPHSTTLTPLQAKMRNKLTSARFRHLNQTLYTSSSSDALQLFSNSPDLFGEYHAGFSQQVKDSWPQNPVDVYIREIKERGKIHDHRIDGQSTTKLPLPRRKTGRCTIADLGCGDAPLARGCQSQVKALQLRFHNFDLHAPNSFVTKADIADLPLRDGEADVAVFCLSLMGTNWIDFVEEAWRVLRGDGKGEVWVAEVKSRFGRVKSKVVENSVGNKKKAKKPKKDTAKLEDEDGPANSEELFVEDEHARDQEADATDISAFLEVFQRRGFQLREGSVDRSNKMFISAIFTKAGIPKAGKYKGWKWTGREYDKNAARHSGRMKFVDTPEDEVLPEDEARVLKPCVYKSR